MNHLFVGNNNISRLLELADDNALLIDDGPIFGAFQDHFPNAKVFDVKRDTFNPLQRMTVQRARVLSDTIFAAFPGGDNTLTVRNGKRALTTMLLAKSRKAKRFDNLTPPDEEPGTLEAIATVEDMLLSPVLKRILCSVSEERFRFRGMVLVRLNRAELGDIDTFLLSQFLIGQTQGQVIVTDFGFVGRDLNIDLITQNRLIAGVRLLNQVPDTLRAELLRIEDQEGNHVHPDDALELAKCARLIPGTNEHTDFVQRLVA